MSRRLVLYSAWVAYVAAWMLPVIKDGVTLPEGLPGWQAFRVAFAPVWPYEGVQFQNWYWAALAVLSALSNVTMLSSPFVLVPRLRRFALACGWAAVTGVVIDSHWFVLGLQDDDWAGLRIGYFLWWGSFLLLTMSMFSLRKSQERSAAQLTA